MVAGAQEIVLLPGLDGTGELFERLAGHLGAEFTVRIVRYPNDPSLGYAGYAELVRNVIGTREVYLLGESFSGPVAIRVASQLGRQIRGLLLAATFLKAPWPGWLLRRASRVDPETTPPKIRDTILMGPYGDPELRQKVNEIVRNLSRPVRAARLRAVAEVDVRDDFAKLSCPILALHGRDDWLVSKTAMQKAICRKGGARMIVFPAAHMLLQTGAADAAAEIIAFAKSSALRESHYED
ncbi:alpha/beta hydrolase [Hyphomicrobium sp.]|jgi:pimeloyl-ACP methyl ester carboxylesterase|uniref:alpha/beta fold hydrolase n=1 Tax=Hyphomicrobium sp. TaxID=82 RepID=UPI002B79EA78|nr:alpha/beta hydrolase [Hyphomicrobium sp.]HVZ03521.1 alpha/beta hydrolase [Hyphomicrobium sp.]